MMTNYNTCLNMMDLSSEGSIEGLSAQLRDVIDSGALQSNGWLRVNTSCLDSTEKFHALLNNMGCQLLDYEFGSTPRTELKSGVYSSTEYPEDQEILLHNEMSYTTRWPERVWFFCEKPSTTGGETPIADSREVYRKLDPKITKIFEEKKLLYIRNYIPGLDVPWQKVFNTSDKKIVASMCHAMDINYRWQGDELKTWQLCQSVTAHPKTQEVVWFNQAHLFHHSSLSPEYRELLTSMFAEDELPRNVMFSDRTPIPESMLEEIKGVMHEEKQKLSWQQGEIMILDNLLFAHGREPFQGERRIAVAME